MDIGAFNSSGGNLANAVDIVGAGALSLTGQNGQAGVFSATATGVTGAVLGTGSLPILHNPAGNNKLFRIISVRYGDVSGTIIRANIRYAFLDLVATAATISAQTAGAIRSMTRNVASTGFFYTAATLSAITGAVQMATGLGSGGAIAAQFYNLRSDEEGIVTVKPGELFYPYISNAAIAMVADVTVIWAETPIPTGA